jgi:dihydroxy-acid dehydratase
LIQDGDQVVIDAEKKEISVDVSDTEMAQRRAKWQAPPLKKTSGTLFKYTQLVRSGSKIAWR